MDKETSDWIDCSMGEIAKCIEELKWQKYLMLLPNKFSAVEADPRNLILLYLSWLLTDLFDAHWGGFTPLEVAQIVRDIADAITRCTESQ